MEADYGTPFLNHATLEPMNCTARVDADDGGDGGGLGRHPERRRDPGRRGGGGGVPLENVKVNKYLLGGGFGRRGQQDYTRQAVLLAKQVPGRPVKLIWSREEDMQHGFYRPITQAR